MGKGLSPLPLHGPRGHFCTARMEGQVDVVDLLDVLVFTAKEEMVSPQWLFGV